MRCPRHLARRRFGRLGGLPRDSKPQNRKFRKPRVSKVNAGWGFEPPVNSNVTRGELKKGNRFERASHLEGELQKGCAGGSGFAGACRGVRVFPVHGAGSGYAIWKIRYCSGIRGGLPPTCSCQHRECSSRLLVLVRSTTFTASLM